MPIQLILSDLDGTLLTSEKGISPGTLAALERATAMGVHFVPSSGRFFEGMPQQVRQLPFVRYAIEVNGAWVRDVWENKVLYRAEMSADQVLAVYDYLDTLPVVYDTYRESRGYMDAAMHARLDEFLAEFKQPERVKALRKPVENLRSIIADENWSSQRVQAYFNDMDLLREQEKAIQERFPTLLVTNSNPTTLEITAGGASKGQALAALCAYLGVDIGDTIAFGDRDNDSDMLLAAGIGVAMGNAVEELKAVADYITDSNDEDGIARAIERFVYAEGDAPGASVQHDSPPPTSREK